MAKYLYSFPMTKNLDTLTSLTMDELLRIKRASGISNVQLGQVLGLNRQSVGARFNKQHNMSLDEFIGTAKAAGELPSEILRRAEARSTTKVDATPSAFAEEEK